MGNDKRFETIHRERHGLSEAVHIIRDTHTGVCYIVDQVGYGGGITPLLDGDGRPVVMR